MLYLKLLIFLVFSVYFEFILIYSKCIYKIQLLFIFQEFSHNIKKKELLTYRYWYIVGRIVISVHLKKDCPLAKDVGLSHAACPIPIPPHITIVSCHV